MSAQSKPPADKFEIVFEGTTFCSGIPSVVGKLSNGFRDENFIRTIEENVTTPLIEGHFQPGPSLEGFIKVVRKIERLVSIGQITTAHEVEVGLKWAGRVSYPSIRPNERRLTATEHYAVYGALWDLFEPCKRPVQCCLSSAARRSCAPDRELYRKH